MHSPVRQEHPAELAYLLAVVAQIMDGGGLREGGDQFVQIDRELDVHATFYRELDSSRLFYLGADSGFLVGTLCRGTDYSHHAASCCQKRTSYCLNCPLT